MTLGNKIRRFRKQKGISQFDLELAIETSNGRLSKIESDKINPDKETIIAIANELQLNSIEIASLFGIEVPKVGTLIDDVCGLFLCESREEIIDEVVNGLVFKLGFIASAVFMVEEEKIFMRGLTYSNIAQKALRLVPRPLEELYIPLQDETNVTARVIRNGCAQLTGTTASYVSPLVDMNTANQIQQVTGDKSVMIFPLEIQQRKLGAICFVKKIESDFIDERELLEVVSKLVAVALFKVTK